MSAGSAPLAAVTFDYWNTLCYEPAAGYLRSRRLAATMAVLDDAGVGFDAARLESAYDVTWREFDRAWNENRQFTGADAARHFVGLLAEWCPPGTLLRDRLLEAFATASQGCELVLVDGVGDVLGELRSRGVRVGIVCDVGLTPSPVLREQLDRHGLLGCFDHWSFSDEVGVYKPDRRIFEHALAGLGGPEPARAAHVGDRRRTDIAGATQLGMTAVRFTGVFDDDDPTQGPPGDVVIASYAELFPALGLG